MAETISEEAWTLNLLDKDLHLLNMLKKLRETTDKEPKKTRRIIYEQTDTICIRIKNILLKKESNRTCNLKSKIAEIKNSVERLQNKLSRQKAESKNLKMEQLKLSSLRSRKKRNEGNRAQGTLKQTNICIMGISEGAEKGAERVFEEIRAELFLTLKKECIYTSKKMNEF